MSTRILGAALIFLATATATAAGAAEPQPAPAKTDAPGTLKDAHRQGYTACQTGRNCLELSPKPFVPCQTSASNKCEDKPKVEPASPAKPPGK